MLQEKSSESKKLQEKSSESEKGRDLEKNMEFLFKLVYKFYENQIKLSEFTNTFLGFIIAANGVILLGLLTLTFSNNLIILKTSWPIQLFIVLNILFTCLSIWLCLAFIITSKPIPFSIKRTPLQLIDQTFNELHTDAFNALNTSIEENTLKFEKGTKILIWGIVSFGFSLVTIFAVIGSYLLIYTK
jgi:hypothetical protein